MHVFITLPSAAETFFLAAQLAIGTPLRGYFWAFIAHDAVLLGRVKGEVSAILISLARLDASN